MEGGGGPGGAVVVGAVRLFVLQSLCKSLEIRYHTKKYNFQPTVPQPSQQSYDWGPGSRYLTHIRATLDVHIKD